MAMVGEVLMSNGQITLSRVSIGIQRECSRSAPSRGCPSAGRFAPESWTATNSLIGSQDSDRVGQGITSLKQWQLGRRQQFLAFGRSEDPWCNHLASGTQRVR